MNKHWKFATLITLILRSLLWLGATGISGSKTHCVQASEQRPSK